MHSERDAAPAWQGKGGGGCEADSGRLSRPQYTAAGRDRQPVYSAAGRVVGFVGSDGVLRKSVQPDHYLRRPPAIAWDVCALEEAEDLGATRCEVEDAETGAVYSAPLADFWRFGFPIDRGHGAQRALVLERWQVRRPGQIEALQLGLFGGTP
ncbi:MAG: hypothetical protein GX605_02560 [Chloroflexi bacterium]|nr:hypothetical protein [Chloroflexota bacterium]